MRKYKTQVYYNDIDNFCCDVLKKNIRNGNLYSGIVDRRDIKDISGEELKQYGQVHLFAGIGAFPLGFRWARMPASISIVTAGVPCQPHSVAGKRKGKEDDRNLWPETIRIVAEHRPTWFVFENVLGIRTTILDEVLSDLDDLAYSTRTLIVPACALNAPHRRERIFVIAYTQGDIWQASRNDRPIPFNGSSSLMAYTEQPISRRGAITRKGNGQERQFAEAEQASLQPRDGKTHSSITKPSSEDVADTQGRRIKGVFSSGENSRRFSSSSWWTTEPDVGGITNGLSPRLDGDRRLTNKTHECIITNGDIHHANAEKEGTRKILQILRSGDAPQALRWSPRGLWGFQAQEVLQSEMRQQSQAPETLGDVSLESQEASGEIVRSVRYNREPACSSCRRRFEKQQKRKYTNTLHLVSQLLTCDCGSAWLETTGETAKASLNFWSGDWEQNIPRVANKIPNRVHRLRTLGNAVVPQVAQWIGERIMEIVAQ